jgi:predicted RNA binding protein YcfA (HicA-like mRNA interferase family)
MNQRLPSLTAREAVRALEKAGFVVTRTSGSHARLVHAADPRRQVTIPMHTGDIKRGTLRAIIGQAGLSVADFIALL